MIFSVFAMKDEDPQGRSTRHLCALSVHEKSGLIRAVARRWKVPEYDHDDIVQDVVIAAMISPFDPDGPGTFSAWVAGVTTRVCCNRHRSIVVSRRNLPSLEHSEWADYGRYWSRSPEAAASAREEQKIVREALESLGPEQIEAASAHYLDDLTPLEIGDAIGVTGGAISSRLHRASKTLREKLASTYDPEADPSELARRRKVVVWRAAHGRKPRPRKPTGDVTTHAADRYAERFEPGITRAAARIVIREGSRKAVPVGRDACVVYARNPEIKEIEYVFAQDGAVKTVLHTAMDLPFRRPIET